MSSLLLGRDGESGRRHRRRWSAFAGIALVILGQGRAMAADETRQYHACCGRPGSWHEFSTTVVALAGNAGLQPALGASGDPPHGNR